MKTNDLKKNDVIKLRNGWRAQLMDNKKGSIRFARVFGDYNELGPIYSHDIVEYQLDHQWFSDIELTKSQEKCLKTNQTLGFGY